MSGKTSTRAKRRYNERHYEKLYVAVPIGARDEIHAAAAAHGLSTAAYIRHLVLADNPDRAFPVLGGGGVVQSWIRAMTRRSNSSKHDMGFGGGFE